ncbi:MAG: Alanine racemase [Clostridia bacterium 41_269]|nr:MAG: Alanine racemase [Clostridia bacterium 41_269]
MYKGEKDMALPSFIGPRWVEIDLDAVKFNVAQIKKLLSPETKLMAVVKADGYGFGAVEVSKAALEAGADMLGVTTIDEGLELREMEVEAPILVFTPFMPEEKDVFINYNFTATVGSYAAAETLLKENLEHSLKVHIKVNTGMNRLGMEPKEAVEFVSRVYGNPFIEVEGIYTHFAVTPRKNRNFVEKQFKTFMEVVSSLEDKGYSIPIKHVCSSAALLDMPHMHMDMVRVGTLIYGQYPFGYEKIIPLKDPWKVKAKIIHVKKVFPGEKIGYGGDFTVKKAVRIGIIPVGYADSFGTAPEMNPKNFLDLLKMIIKKIFAYFGIRAGMPLVKLADLPLRVLGRIGMQFTAVELPDENADVGSIVSVFIRRTNSSSRLPRVYISEKRVIGIRVPWGKRSCIQRQGEYS